MTSSAVRAKARARGMCTQCQRRKIAVGRSRSRCVVCLLIDSSKKRSKHEGVVLKACIICGRAGHYQATCPDRAISPDEESRRAAE
jgi:hypothetical protein